VAALLGLVARDPRGVVVREGGRVTGPVEQRR
jgi:hypothetical protein